MATNEINANNKCGTQDVYASTTAYNAENEHIKKALSALETVFLARIVSCSSSGEGGSKTVNAVPLIAKVDANGNAQPTPTYVELPHYRFQAGTGALIIDPEVGDIGVFVVCKRDISNINSQTEKTQVPNTFRAFSPSDSVMIATIHTKSPETWIHIKPQQKEIVIKADSGVTINTSSKVTVNAAEVDINAALTKLSGNLEVAGTIQSQDQITGAGINFNTHVHGNVQSGSSDTSGPK